VNLPPLNRLLLVWRPAGLSDATTAAAPSASDTTHPAIKPAYNDTTWSPEAADAFALEQLVKLAATGRLPSATV